MPKIIDQVLDPIEITCAKCGETFKMYPSEQNYFKKKGFELPKMCKACRDKRKILTEFICCDCGKPFALMQKEIDYYTNNNLNLPKRCRSCLEGKRIRNKEKANNS